MEASRALAVQLLGGFHVGVAGQAVPESAWRQKRAAAIVKLLALEPTHRLHREQITDALWPDHEPAAAANNLRVMLHHARQCLRAAEAPPGPFLTRDGDAIVLGPPDLLQVDVDLFAAALRDAWRSSDPAVARLAIDRYGGDLLPGDPYEDWAAGRRTTLRTSYLTLLRRLAGLHEQRAERDQAVAAWQRLVAEEPLDEEAQVALMRLFAAAGQPRRALAQYDTLVEALARELGAEPELATRELIATIQAGGYPETAPSPAPVISAGAVAAPRPSGLPAPVDDLIGREREEAELRHLLGTARLVTLTGPGGVGKTRLGLAVAHAVAPAFPDGAVFVDLAPLDDPDLVLPAIASACGVQEEGGQSLLDTVTADLGSRSLLLVIDNMEHLAAAAPVVAELLAACPGLKALITSRGRLRLRGEQEYPVQPLEFPDPPAAHADWVTMALPAMPAAEAPAVTLFIRRARAARPGYTLGAADAEAVAEICRRLDGLPLAIELAAARVRLLSTGELLEQLERPLGMLTGGPRDAPARQRTLRATIGWSHDLLTPEEQDFFARLAVFAGGFTLDAAEAIGGGGFALEGERSVSPFVLDLLASLVDHSLVRQTTGADGASRFGMLETIREYARERLEFSGEAETVRLQHAAVYLALAEAAAPELTGPDQAIWTDRLAIEHDNLRQALSTLHEHGAAEEELRLAAALWRFWWQRGYLSEGRQRLEQALAVAPEAGAAMRATAHDGAGALAEARGDLAAAVAHHEAALRLWRELGDRSGEARSLTDAGIVADRMGDSEQALRLFAAAMEIAREEDDRPRLAAVLANLGFVSLDQGSYERAAVAFRESLELFRAMGDQRNLSYVLGGLGTLALLGGDYAGAVAMQDEALRMLRELGDAQGIADTLADLGHAVQRQGDLARAEELYAEALRLYRDLGDPGGAAFTLIHLGRLDRVRGDSARASALLHEGFHIAWQTGETPLQTEAIEGLAEVACDAGEAVRCARLLGVAEAMREAAGTPLPAVHAPAIAHCVTTARAALGEAGFAAARGEGRALAPERAVAALVAELSG